MKVLKSLALFLGLFVSTNVFASETMQCNFGVELGKGLDEKLSTMRERAFDSCLKCEGSSCKMLVYPLESQPAQICKRIFCTPKQIRRIVGEEIPTDLRIGQTKFEFSYKITAKGRVKDVKIISLEGAMNERDAYRWAAGVTRRAIYFPVEVKGRTYEITNLSAAMEVNTGVYDGG